MSAASLVSLASLVAIVAVMVGAFVAYRRTIRGVRTVGETRDVSGARLTNERLRQLPTPPWRFVYEIADDRLAGVDHVVICPAGIFAVDTVIADRPASTAVDDPFQIAAAASKRAAVDELAARVGLRCNELAQVYWGAPRPDEPAMYEPMYGTRAIQGHKLTEWLVSLPPGPLTAAQIDLAWQAITTGIGRPDPLA